MGAQMAHPCKSGEKTPGKASVLQDGPCESHKQTKKDLMCVSAQTRRDTLHEV